MSETQPNPDVVAEFIELFDADIITEVHPRMQHDADEVYMNQDKTVVLASDDVTELGTVSVSDINSSVDDYDKTTVKSSNTELIRLYSNETRHHIKHEYAEKMCEFLGVKTVDNLMSFLSCNSSNGDTYPVKMILPNHVLIIAPFVRG
jgi:hypothetical protein